MWQRFTEKARIAIFNAQEEAQRLGGSDVSVEHILLGLIRSPDGTAFRVLVGLGVKPDQVREETEKLLTAGNATPTQDLMLTPRAKAVIDLAYEAARQLNNNYIGTEHLLLGILQEGESLAARVLTQLGVDLATARQAVLKAQEEAGPRDEWDGEQPDRGEHGRSRTVTLFLMLIEETSEPVQSILSLCTDLGEVTQLLEALLLTMPDVPQEATMEELLALAQEEARALRSDQVRSEHLLLALLAPHSLLPTVLEPFGLTLDRARTVLRDRD
jgi:ATP-dependent Clp protease ATP-binding subunit ClpA